MPQNRPPLAVALAVALALLGSSGTADAAKRRHRHRNRHPHARAHAAVPVKPVPSAPASPAPAAPAPPPAPPVTASPGAAFGRVALVTEHRVYLDRGAVNGLAPGQSLALARFGRPAGSCTVDVVGDHEATCVGNRARVGDTFRTARAGARRATVKAAARVIPVLAPLVDEQTLQARAAVIAAGTIEKVEFNGGHAFRGRATAEVMPGVVAWFTQPDAQGGGYAQERIDAVIRGVPLGGSGFQFDGAFAAMRWTAPAVERFRPDTPTQFYLWEAEASRRMQQGGTTVAVGRLWPYHTPGLTLLDGIQLGRQNQARTAEGGLYGGLIPSAASLAPAFDIWAAGLYGALTQVGTRESTLRLAREEARVGVWHGARTVTEAEALAQAWIGPVVAGGGGRLRWAEGGGGLAVEQAHLDLGVRPSPRSGAGLHARYVGATLLPDAPLRAELPMTGGALHALGDVHLELSTRLALAASAGAHREGMTGRHQLHAGAEVRFLRLFGEAGGLWVGGDVEQGWMQGENLYVQFVGQGARRLQILARLSANGTRFETPTAIWNLHELGGYANLDGVLTSWLRLRAWTLLRAPILVQGALPVEASFGAVAGLGLAGAI